MISLKNYFITTTDSVDVISIIHEINLTVKESGIPDGVVSVMVPGPGAGVAIIEPLPEIVGQLKSALEVFPGAGVETMNRRKEEIAVGPRVAAAMLGKSLQIPLSKGKLILGLREEVVLIDMENKISRREFYVQVMGEKPADKQQQRGGPPR